MQTWTALVRYDLLTLTSTTTNIFQDAQRALWKNIGISVITPCGSGLVTDGLSTRFDFSNGRPLGPKSKSIITPQNSPTPMCKPVPIRFGGKENLDSGRMNSRNMSAAPSGWNLGLFHNDFSNPLHAHPHAHTFSYGDRENIQADFKPGTSSFDSDFRPMTATNSFTAVRTHGFLSRPERSMGNDVHFGR